MSTSRRGKKASGSSRAIVSLTEQRQSLLLRSIVGIATYMASNKNGGDGHEDRRETVTGGDAALVPTIERAAANVVDKAKLALIPDIFT